MRNLFYWRFGVVLAGILLIAASAQAQESEFSLSAGYSHLYGLSQGLFHNPDGVYVDGDLAWHVPDPRSPLLAGLGISGSGYFDEHDTGLPLYDNYGYYYGNAHLYSDVGLFEIEPRIGVALWSTLLPGLFVKPRIGAGLMIDNYAIDQLYSNGGNSLYINTHYHTGAAFEVHPAIQAGYTWGPGSLGAEISYMPAWGDFGRLGNSLQELRIGAFYTFRF